MQTMLLLLGAAALAFWILWWMTFRALREAQRENARKQSCIEDQIQLIEQLVMERQMGWDGEMPDRGMRTRARQEVRQLLRKV